MSRGKRLCALTLLLLLSLAASPALAAGKAPARQKAPTAMAWLWHALDRLLPGIAKGRGGMDPDGSPAPAAGTASTSGGTTDGRGGMDPDGHT